MCRQPALDRGGPTPRHESSGGCALVPDPPVPCPPPALQRYDKAPLRFQFFALLILSSITIRQATYGTPAFHHDVMRPASLHPSVLCICPPHSSHPLPPLLYSRRALRPAAQLGVLPLARRDAPAAPLPRPPGHLHFRVQPGHEPHDLHPEAALGHVSLHVARLNFNVAEPRVGEGRGEAEIGEPLPGRSTRDQWAEGQGTRRHR